jgi:hypothetical protein
MRRLASLATLTALAITACSGEAGPTLDWEPAHTSTHWWMSVTATAPDDQWVVGGTTTDGAVLRFDGTTATEVETGLDVGLLNWVHRFDSGEFVVVGNEGAVIRSEDGTTWTADDRPTDQDLWGVWGSAPNDVWAVGGDAADGEPTVLHDTGDGFQPVVLPDLQRPGVRVIFKVWGSGSDDVYFVGQNGVVLHWNGSGFEELFVGIGEDLIGVWGTSPDRVAVVGGRRNAQAALWDGSEWRTIDLARFSGLNGVWLDGDTVYIVGNDGVTGTIDFVSGAPSIVSIDTPVALHAISGTSEGLTAVGGDFSTGETGPFLGQVVTTDRG